MANFFENLIARGLAGGIQGSIEQFLAEQHAKKKAIAEAWGRGRGAVPTDALPSFLRAGWGVGEQLEETPYDYMLSKPPPDIHTQLSPLSRSGEADYRPGPMQRGYASIESPAVIGERKLKHKMISQMPQDPGTQMYMYLSTPEDQGGLGWDKYKSQLMTKKTFPDFEFTPEETISERKAVDRVEVDKRWSSGEINYENWPTPGVMDWHETLLSVELKYLSMDQIKERFNVRDKSTRDLLYEGYWLTADPNGPQHDLGELQQRYPYHYFILNWAMEPDFAPRLWGEEFIKDIPKLPEEIQKRLIGTTIFKPEYYKNLFGKWLKSQGVSGELSDADNAEYAMQFADTFTDSAEQQAAIYALTGAWPLEWGEERAGEKLPPEYMGGVELSPVPERFRTPTQESPTKKPAVAPLGTNEELLRKLEELEERLNQLKGQ